MKRHLLVIDAARPSFRLQSLPVKTLEKDPHAGVTGQARHLATAAVLGLGTDDPAQIDWRELTL